jgi:ribosome-associated translation inhibitor RaiA
MSTATETATAIIVAEHFEISDDTRNWMQKAIGAVGDFVQRASSVRLNLKRRPRHGFEATLTVHSAGKDFVYHESHDRLDALIRRLSTNVKRQLVEQKRKRVDRYRRAKIDRALTSP